MSALATKRVAAGCVQSMPRLPMLAGALLPARPHSRRSLATSAPRLKLTMDMAALCHRVESQVDMPSFPVHKPRVPRPTAKKDLDQLNLGFIGWGAMAQAVSLGVVRMDLTKAEKVLCTDVVPEILEAARKEGLQVKTSIEEIISECQVVVVATKPQVVDSVIVDIAKHWTKDKILVSICAGVTINTYRRGLGADAKVIRVMPNTPCLVGEAATAYAGSRSCLEWELDLVHNMFEAVGGATHKVPEYLLNTVTGLSGSGPAYIYMLIQAMSDAGVHGGLPRAVATSLAAQTVVGAAKMVQETGQHPAVLKEAVTSPAGTTIAGVRALEKNGFNNAILEAVEAARQRSEELSQEPDFLHAQVSSMDTP